jgi:hypothetical protein
VAVAGMAAVWEVVGGRQVMCAQCVSLKIVAKCALTKRNKSTFCNRAKISPVSVAVEAILQQGVN